MKKLIELIIEFQKETGQSTYDLDMYHYDDELKLIIIGSDVSKGFIDYIDIFRLLFAPGFIQWLVDNDKIDNFYYENSVRVKRYIDEYEEYDYVFPMDYEQLIMLLSIENNPIEWLCEILK